MIIKYLIVSAKIRDNYIKCDWIGPALLWNTEGKHFVPQTEVFQQCAINSDEISFLCPNSGYSVSVFDMINSQER